MRRIVRSLDIRRPTSGRIQHQLPVCQGFIGRTSGRYAIRVRALDRPHSRSLWSRCPYDVGRRISVSRTTSPHWRNRARRDRPPGAAPPVVPEVHGRARRCRRPLLVAGRLFFRPAVHQRHRWREGRQGRHAHRGHRLRERRKLGPDPDRVRLLHGRQPPHLRGSARHRPDLAGALRGPGHRGPLRPHRHLVEVHTAGRGHLPRRQTRHRRRRGLRLRPDSRPEHPDPRQGILRELAEGGPRGRRLDGRADPQVPLPRRPFTADPGEGHATARLLPAGRLGRRDQGEGGRLRALPADRPPPQVEHHLRGLRRLQRPAPARLQADELADDRGRGPARREDLGRQQPARRSPTTSRTPTSSSSRRAA